MKILVETVHEPAVVEEMTVPEDALPAVSPKLPYYWVGKTQYCHVREDEDGNWVYRRVHG